MRRGRVRERRRRFRGGRVLLAVLIVFLYLILFPRGFSAELLIQRRWSRSLAAEAEDRSPEAPAGALRAGEALPFELSGYFGFIDARGNFLYRGRSLFGVALDRERFANYSRISETTVVQGRDGSLLQRIPSRGYPVLEAGRTLIFAPDGRSLSEWSPEEGLLWERSFPALLTDLDVRGESISLAFLDGSIGLLVEGGGRILRFEPRGSRVEVTYGVAGNADSSRVAAISGLDPQRITVLESSSNGLTPVQQLELEEEYRRPVFMEFVTPELLVVEQPTGALLVNTSDGSSRRLSLGGPVSRVDYLETPELIGLIRASAETVRREQVLYLIRPDGRRVVERHLGRESSTIGFIGDTLILGRGNYLLGLGLEEG